MDIKNEKRIFRKDKKRKRKKRGGLIYLFARPAGQQSNSFYVHYVKVHLRININRACSKVQSENNIIIIDII